MKIPDSSVSFLFISDTHGALNYGPDYYGQKYDILSEQFPSAVFLLGDIYRMELIRIKKIFDEKNVPVFAIHGNHEPISHIEETGITNLHGSSCNIKGLTVAGMGGCVRYREDPEVCMMSDEESLNFARSLPKADIFISHASCKVPGDPLDVHSGLKGVSWYVDHYKPAFHFYGHNHNRKIVMNEGGTVSYCVYQAGIFKMTSGEMKYLF